jgi:hypothetical protein
MHTGDTGGERGLEGTGVRGDWRRTGATGLPDNKSAAKLQEPAGGNTHAQKRLIRQPRYAKCARTPLLF